MIRPSGSQAIGLVVSMVVGFVVYFGISVFLKSTLTFWHMGEILSLLVGIPLGGIVGYEMFASRRRDVEINSVGICKLFGELTTLTFGEGRHWVPPFMEILTLPGPKQKFLLEIPGEKIEAKDGAEIYFGIPENGGKENQIQYSITNPLRFIAVDNIEKELCGAYMEAARLFFGQVAEVAGMRNEGRLFPDFLMLTAADAEFEHRLSVAMFKDGEQEERLFDDDAVRVLMREAGTFVQMAASCGISNITAFIPNVRENPAARAAAEERQVAEEKAAMLTVKIDSVKKHVREMKDLGATPDMILASVMKMNGENVTITHANYSGLSGASVIVGVGNMEMLTKEARK